MVAYEQVQYNIEMISIGCRRPRLSDLLLILVLSYASCAGNPAPAQRAPAAPPAAEAESAPAPAADAATIGARFIPAAAARPEVPTAIGVLAPVLARRMASGDVSILAAAFRAAYIEAIFRGHLLEGALGGDRVTGWLFDAPEAYVQNWRSSTPSPNSWGLPALVLAARPVGGDRAFVVRGAVLDAYGRGEGVGGANGVAGYGAPRSDEFPYEGGIAQRFERGLIVVGAEGSRRFDPRGAPYAAAAPDGKVGSLGDSPPPRLSAEAIAATFRSAWVSAVDRGFPAAEADGPVRVLPLPAVASADAPSSAPSVDGEVPAEGSKKAAPLVPVRLESALVQTFGKSGWALVLPVGAGTSGRACILAPPFLDLLLSEGSWEAGFGAYGAPLADPGLRDGKVAQRFSAGWMEAD